MLKRYIDEPDSAWTCLLASHSPLLTARHTIVEVRRNHARLLDERNENAAKRLLEDSVPFGIVELHRFTRETAADIAD